MSRPFSRVLLTAGLIALSIGAVTSAGALPAQATTTSNDASVDGLLDTSENASGEASPPGYAADAIAAVDAIGASTANESPAGPEGTGISGGIAAADGSAPAEGTAAKERECAAPLEDFEVYDLTETGFKLRWTLPDNHPEYVDYFMDGLGSYVLTVGEFPFTEAIGENIKPGTHYAVGVVYICSDGSMTGTPMLKFVTPGVPPAPDFEFGPQAAATMNSSSDAGPAAAANATGDSSGSGPAEDSENATASATASSIGSATTEPSENAPISSAAESSAFSSDSGAVEGTANAVGLSPDVDAPAVLPASVKTSDSVANASGSLNEGAWTGAAQVQTKALANTGQSAGGLQLVSVGLVGTGLIALLGSIAHRLRNRQA